MSPQYSDILNPLTLPFQGRQLIEASAGTGKTFNITRLYLRAILERKLNVEQILVMTFSKAATEEIRGRVAETLSEAQSYWHKRLSGEAEQDGDDPVYRQLFDLFPDKKAYARIKSNLLLIDDAAIYTIHGFCQQMLASYAYDTGNALNTVLNNDTQDVLLDCTADWLRTRNQSPEELLLLGEFGWHTPHGFLDRFAKLIRSTLPVKALDAGQLVADKHAALDSAMASLIPRGETVKQHIQHNYDWLRQALTQHKTAKTQVEREAEWQCFMDWLNDSEPKVPEKPVASLLHGNRYRGKEEVKEALAPVKDYIKEIKSAFDDIETNAQRREAQLSAYRLVAEGAEWIAQRFKEKKAQQGWLEFDDLVTGLADNVVNNSMLATTLRQRFPLALVDEFQDTDSAQYKLLAAIYPNGQPELRSEESALLMIGDPKQAIYGFRGGDIFTYLAASEEADARWFMDTNWRSTPEMVIAYNCLFNAVPFDFNMTYQAVNFAASAKANRTPLSDAYQHDNEDATEPSALKLCWFESEQEKPNKEAMRQQQASWLASEVERLLAQARLGDNKVATRDIAVLVRTGADARLIKGAFDRAGIASVYMSNQQSIYQTQQAEDCLRVLIGVNAYQNSKKLKSALVSPLFGFDNTTYNALFVEDNEQTWDHTLRFFESLKVTWLKDGVLAMLQRLIDKHLQLPQQQAERVLSNYQHLAELLQSHCNLSHLYEPQALIDWLWEQIANPPLSDESSIERLESDRDAIQIITQHKSKGLEYPIVFVPFANDYRDASRAGASRAAVCQFYDSDEKQLILQVGDSHQALERIKREADAEAARLLYVAVTRAAHRCYLLCSAFSHSEQSTLGKAFGVDDSGWPVSLQRFAGQSQYVEYLQAVDQHGEATHQEIDSNNQAVIMHQPKAFTLKSDNWRLLSYSALSHSQVRWRRSRADELEAVVVSEPAGVQTELPARFAFPKGAAPGNVLHDALERHDFASEHFSDEVRTSIASLCKEPGVDEVTTWLNEVLDAPFELGGHRLTLRDVPLQKTLREAEFYFPLNKLDLSALMTWLHDFSGRSPAEDAMQTQIEGMMHGFIDLIFESNGRYFVADYKSTFMGNQLTDYNTHALTLNMLQHHYDLQASIYALALHRYLARSLKGYRPEEHFGGVVYFYLRGMHPHNSDSEGVVNLPVNAQKLAELDQIFDPVGVV